MVLEISDITELIKLFETKYDTIFMIDIMGRWVKDTTQTYNIKEKKIIFLNGPKF